MRPTRAFPGAARLAIAIVTAVLTLTGTGASAGAQTEKTRDAQGASAPTTTAVNPPPQLRFGDIPWGAGPATLKRGMEKAGLKFTGADETGEYSFEGDMGSYPVAVVAIMTPGKELVKISVIIGTPENEALSVYREMVDALTKSYGVPTASFETAGAPYTTGDGSEEAAIKAGKAPALSCWGACGTSAHGELIGIELTEDLHVSIQYESADWKKEHARRHPEEAGRP